MLSGKRRNELLWDSALFGDGIQKQGLVARKANGMWCVVFRIPKEYETTGAAHRGRLRRQSVRLRPPAPVYTYDLRRLGQLCI